MRVAGKLFGSSYLTKQADLAAMVTGGCVVLAGMYCLGTYANHRSPEVVAATT